VTATEKTVLPVGWRVAKIGDLFDSWGGHTPSKSNRTYWGEGLPWVSSRDVKAPRLTTSTYAVTQRAVEETGLKVCPPGSVLVVVRSGILAHALPVSIAERPVAINQDLKAFYSDEPLMNEWLALFLRMSAHELLASSRRDGTTVQSIQYPLLKNTLMPIPPLKQRRRIIEVLEDALHKQASVPAHLVAARRAIGRFRQAVFAAACSGRLTADWREANRGAPRAESLLSEIDSLRKGRYRAPAAGWVFEIPDTWELVSLNRLTELITSGSRGWAKHYSSDGPLFIRAQNISSDRLDLEDMAHVRPPKGSEGERTAVQKGDLLVTITGANVTKSGFVDRDIGEAYVNQHVALARPILPQLTEFLHLWLVSPEHGRKKLSTDAYGAGRPGLNLDNLRTMPVSLPPVEEQVEIITRTKALFALADRIDLQIASAARQVGRSSQAILAKAFRGGLIPPRLSER
jgi:type I restriction enzyme, S subunit